MNRFTSDAYFAIIVVYSYEFSFVIQIYKNEFFPCTCCQLFCLSSSYTIHTTLFHFRILSGFSICYGTTDAWRKPKTLHISSDVLRQCIWKYLWEIKKYRSRIGARSVLWFINAFQSWQFSFDETNHPKVWTT